MSRNTRSRFMTFILAILILAPVHYIDLSYAQTAESLIQENIKQNAHKHSAKTLEEEYQRLLRENGNKSIKLLPAKEQGTKLSVPNSAVGINKCGKAGCLCTGSFCADLIDTNNCEDIRCVKTDEGPQCLCEF